MSLFVPTLQDALLAFLVAVAVSVFLRRLQRSYVRVISVSKKQMPDSYLQ